MAKHVEMVKVPMADQLAAVLRPAYERGMHVDEIFDALGQALEKATGNELVDRKKIEVDAVDHLKKTLKILSKYLVMQVG